MTRGNYIAIIAILIVLGGLCVATPSRSEAAGDYYYNAGRRVPIVRSITRVAVLAPPTSDKVAIVDALRSAPGVSAVRDIRAAGIIEATAAPDDVRRALPTGSALVPVYYEPGTERDASTLFVTGEALVQFKASVSVDTIRELSDRFGFEVVRSLDYASNGFLVRSIAPGESSTGLTVANALYETGLCVFAHPNFLASRSLRRTLNDPELVNQWHLVNTAQGGGLAGADVKASQAWDLTLGDPSVIVAIADTGIDYHHGDFAVQIDGIDKVTSPRDVVHGDDDPFPQSGDFSVAHGTSAAGVAVAAGDNSYATTGIAPNCRLMPIQLYAESTFTPNATEADAFTWAADHGAAIMSNSWGPDNNDTPLPDATRAAIDHATTSGRGGKGTVIFFAAGNSADDTVHDNYVSYSGVVGVAASTNQDFRAGYSRYGDAVSVAAPSSGGTLGITTTDLTGPGGYSGGDVTFGFGGTSSASPLAAGVAALVLSVNPDLTWQQVKQVLEETADKIDPGAGGYDSNGHSALYGFGRVNAFAAVTRAIELANSDLPRVTFASSPVAAGAGGSLALAWSTGGPNAIASQSLAYSTDGGAHYTAIGDVAPGTTNFAWQVPASLTGTVKVRVTVTDTQDMVATDDFSVPVWALPSIDTVKLKKSSSGKLSLVVDGAAIRLDEALLFVGDTELGSIKFPANHQNGDGTTTRIVSKDSRLKNLIPKGSTVQITIRQAATGQVSEASAFTR